MSHSKFSPGPWRYCKEDSGGCICGQVWSSPQDFNVAIAIHKDEEIGEIPIDQMKANARLIASAPDMHELLSDMLMSNQITEYAPFYRSKIKSLLNKIDNV